MSSVLRPVTGRAPRVGPLRVGPLGNADRDELCRLVDDDPLVNCVISARLRQLESIEPRAFGGVLLGARAPDGALAGAAFVGGNVLPIGGREAEWRVLGQHLAGAPRMCTSIVGGAAAVTRLWSVIEPAWGPARVVRAAQPLLALDRGADLPRGDGRVAAIRADELELYLPAAAAMFTEELGVSPYVTAGVGDYRRRVAGLIRAGRALGIVDATGVVFKADIGSVSLHTCQVQGVWVRPDHRGRGLGTSALAAVLRHGLTLAPTVSLYVNDFNTPARRMYARLGMREAATLSTVLF